MMPKLKNHIVRGLLYAFLILLAVICLVPFYMMLINATRTGNEIMTGFSLIPGTNILENWAVVQKNMNIFQGMKNSLFISICVTVLSSYFSTLTAYGLAFYKFRGRNLIFTTILVFIMVPSQLSLIGFYDLCNKLKLVNSYIPLIIPAIASPAVVFFLRQYILSVLPKAILEAPRIDGANEMVIFHRIVLPIIAPGIATMAIGTFIGSWNSYLIPLILLNKQEMLTLPVMIGSLQSVRDVATNAGATYMAIAVSVIPILIFFAFCSKYIISSVSAGSVKE